MSCKTIAEKLGVESRIFSFTGLTNLDQASGHTRLAGTQFDLEPPDQPLPVGNGRVVEEANNGVSLYDLGKSCWLVHRW